MTEHKTLSPQEIAAAELGLQHLGLASLRGIATHRAAGPGPVDRMPALIRFLLYILAIAGLAVPWYFNLGFVRDGGSFAPGPFSAAVSANALTLAITWDVYLAAIAFSAWLLHDAKAAGRRHAWIYVVLCFVGGLAFALPLYLARRRPAAR